MLLTLLGNRVIVIPCRETAAMEAMEAFKLGAGAKTITDMEQESLIRREGFNNKTDKNVVIQ